MSPFRLACAAALQQSNSSNTKWLKLPATLQHLYLDFHECRGLGDLGLSAVAKGLPKDLHDLTLKLFSCDRISDEGVATLGQNLPNCLQRLEMDSQGCLGIL